MEKVPRRDAPDAARWYGEHGPTFWIHQFKLLEGIDDRFRVVAIFEPLGNARQIVQQIGRIFRNPEYPKPSETFLLDHSSGYHTDEWKTLYDYDDDLAKETKSTPPLKKRFVSGILDAHPERLYINGSVRRQFAFADADADRDLSVPLAANLLRKAVRFDFAKLVESIAAP